MKEGKFRLHKVLATSALMLLLSTTASFAGHKNYFIKTSVDYGGFGLMSEVVTDDPKGKNTGTGLVTEQTSPYAEEKAGYSYQKVMHYGNISKGGNVDDKNAGYLQISFLKDRRNPTVRTLQYHDLQEQSTKGLVFSFPGLRPDMNGGYQATSNDYMRASLVSDTLTTGLNQALLFIKNNAKDDMSSNYALQLALAKLSYTSENKLYTATMGGTKFTIQPAKATKELIPVNNLETSDYVKISTTDDNGREVYSYFPWRMAKGYRSGQPMHEKVNDVYRSNVQENENEYLTWGQLILQAMLNYDIHGKTEQDYASDVQTVIGQGLGSDLSRTISSVRNQLGLAPMQELVLNMGARPANYHMGVMPSGIRDVSMTIYTLNLIISLTFLAFMIIKLIHQKMVSTTNVIARTSLMEGIKDIAFVAVMLGFFAPMFEVLLELNYLIVRTFSYSSEYMTAFSILGGKTLAMESMAGFILSTMFLSVDLFLNFTYMVRSIVVSFLYALAPIIIVSYLWSPQQKQLVFGFFRELVGNIFMQSFHAITMTFFSGYNTTNLSSLEALTSAYCFIPITQLFRSLILGNHGGFSDKIGGKLAGQVANTTMSLNKAGMTYRHSKDMLETQQKANLQANAISATGQVAGTALSLGAGAKIGAGLGTMIGGPIGTAVGGVVGASIGGLVSAGASAIGTASAQREIGQKQLEISKDQIGMGLAEVGLGMGLSSFDADGGMMRAGLQDVEKGAKTRGEADARYDQNSLTGFGKASVYAGLASGVAVAGNAIERGGQAYERSLPKPPTTYGDRTVMNKLHSEPKNAMSEITANHVHEVRNFNQSRGEFEMVTKIKQDTMAKDFPMVHEAYQAYKQRGVDADGAKEWARISNETGIKEMAFGIGQRLELLMDQRRSGFIGMETNMVNNVEQKMFVVDSEQSRRKIDLD